MAVGRQEPDRQRHGTIQRPLKTIGDHSQSMNVKRRSAGVKVMEVSPSAFGGGSGWNLRVHPDQRRRLEVWKSGGNLELWRIGVLEIWRSGNLVNQERCDSNKSRYMSSLKIKMRSAQKMFARSGPVGKQPLSNKHGATRAGGTHVGQRVQRYLRDVKIHISINTTHGSAETPPQ